MRGKQATVTDEMKQEMQECRDAGMTVTQLAGKYEVSLATVCQYTRPRPAEGIYESKASWPEWRQWDMLHERYGRR